MKKPAKPEQILTPQEEAYLHAVTLPVRLACTSPAGWPVVLSLWYLYQDGELYCATQSDAQVVSYLEQNPQCAFEIAGDLPPYCGIRGQATAQIDAEQGPDVLRRLLTRYLGGTESSLAQKLLAQVETEVALRLRPINSYAWNFSNRMKGLQGTQPGKLCPEV